MGLNLDVEHVAFGALRKFDGRDVRDVDEAELAQIAGRAGRYVQDGTFGAITPLDLPAGVAAAIEGHHFAPIKRVRWRNDVLEFESLAALRESLHAPSTRKVLAKVLEAEDSSALDRLALRDDVMRAARGEEAVRLLWDVCTVPDFRKLLLEVHVDFLERLYLELARRGRLADDWIAAHVRELEKADGDVGDARRAHRRGAHVDLRREPRELARLTARVAGEDARARGSPQRRAARSARDALRRREEGARQRGSRAAPRARKHHEHRRTRPTPSTALDTTPVAEGHPFAKLAALRSALATRTSGHAHAHAHAHAHSRATTAGSPAWAEEAIESTHAELRLDASGRIMHSCIESTDRARWLAARRSRCPTCACIEVDDLGAGAQRRLHRRALAFARDVVSELLGGARELAAASTESSTSIEASAAVRGLVHRLEQGLGTVLARDVADVCAVLDEAAREAVARAGIVLGPVVRVRASRPRAGRDRCAHRARDGVVRRRARAEAARGWRGVVPRRSRDRSRGLRGDRLPGVWCRGRPRRRRGEGRCGLVASPTDAPPPMPRSRAGSDARPARCAASWWRSRLTLGHWFDDAGSGMAMTLGRERRWRRTLGHL